jgi:hypothetical protein
MDRSDLLGPLGEGWRNQRKETKSALHEEAKSSGVAPAPDGGWFPPSRQMGVVMVLRNEHRDGLIQYLALPPLTVPRPNASLPEGKVHGATVAPEPLANADQ